MAYELEQAGDFLDKEKITSSTPDFIEEYKAYKEFLRAVSKENDDEGKEEISEVELAEAVSGIREFVEIYDFDSADSIMTQLKDYSIPDKYKEFARELKKLIVGVEREKIMELIDKTNISGG